jgi:hypothetical protein
MDIDAGGQGTGTIRIDDPHWNGRWVLSAEIILQKDREWVISNIVQTWQRAFPKSSL